MSSLFKSLRPSAPDEMDALQFCEPKRFLRGANMILEPQLKPVKEFFQVPGEVQVPMNACRQWVVTEQGQPTGAPAIADDVQSDFKSANPHFLVRLRKAVQTCDEPRVRQRELGMVGSRDRSDSQFTKVFSVLTGAHT
jgi:hypothetical protein